MQILANRGLTCPDWTCDELKYYEPNDALNSYLDFLQLSDVTDGVNQALMKSGGRL